MKIFFPGSVVQNKAITLLTILVISFCIATIVLAVEKSNAIDDLNDCKSESDGTTTTTTETIPPVTEVYYIFNFFLIY